MIINIADRKIKPEDLKKLPAGTKVILHGRDRRMYATELDCTIVQSGKSKKLAYRDVDGTQKLIPITKKPNKWYEVNE